jgi:hypothetical protein
MKQKSMIDDLCRKGADKDELADRFSKSPSQIETLVNLLNSEKGGTRLAAGNILRRISEKKPELVYPHFDTFAAMIDHENSFLKWGAILIIGNLAPVDTQDKFDKIFRRYYNPITGADMVTAANVIGGLTNLAIAKPHLANSIAKEILKVEKANYKTEECNRVACGHAITSLDRFFDLIDDKKPVIKFVKGQLTSSRKSTRTKAEKFVRKHKL